MNNKRVWRHPENFRQMALDRFRSCESIVQLSKEIGIPRQTLYRWEKKSEQVVAGEEQPTEKSRETRLRREIADLRRLIAEKALEADFFKSALQKIEARQRGSNWTGEPASTTTSWT
jgi:transposase-like protein